MNFLKIENGEPIVYRYNQIDKQFEKRGLLKDNYPNESEFHVILDYESYWNYEFSVSLTSQAAGLKLKRVFSPYEAIAGYLKSKNPGIDKSTEILDTRNGKCRHYSILFNNGKYSLILKDRNEREFSIENLFEEIFEKKFSKISQFSDFINGLDFNGEIRIRSIIEALNFLDVGNNDYNDLFMAFDNPDWMDLKVVSLSDFRKKLLKACNISISENYMMFGELSAIYQKQYDSDHQIADLLGAHYLLQSDDPFYSNINMDVKLKIYIHPSIVEIPLYTKNTSYENYGLPQNIDMINTGSFSILKDMDEIRIDMPQKTLKLEQFEINIDGNHNLVIKNGLRKYIV